MFAFNPAETVEAGFHGIAAREIAKAQDALRRDDVEGDGFDEAVHDARKALKRLRGLVRLVRPSLGGAYRPLNAHWRDTARRLSATRDAGALIETVEALVKEADGQTQGTKAGDDGSRLAAIVKRLGGSQHAMSVGERLALLDPARADLDRGGEMTAEARIDGAYGVLVDGLADTYRRARREGADAWKHYRRNDTGEADDETAYAALLHAWRKRVKYHWTHLVLLAPAWDPVIKARASEAKRLADLLGDHHDLDVLAAKLASEPRLFGGRDDRARLQSLAEAKSRRLAREAHVLGSRLFAEPTRVFRRRFAVWLDLGDAEANGGDGR